MRAKIALFLALSTAFVCFASCGKGNSSNNDENSYQFEEILVAQPSQTLAVGGMTSYPINKDISGKDYVRLQVQTTQNLLGQFVYANVDDHTQIVEEDFFIEAGDEVQFQQFLDGYRANGIGQFDKLLKEIRLTNVGSTQTQVTLQSFSISDRKFPDYEREIYLEKDEIKIGADLAYGGTLMYLARTTYGGQSVDEVIDNNGNVYIGVNADENCKEHLSDSVNLIAIWDAGRQIQQSYYAAVGGTDGTAGDMKKPVGYGSNGYERAWCDTQSDGGHWWPYNPVQGGDVAYNPSQVIDYQITDIDGDGEYDEIYVKTRAMDWAKGRAKTNYPGTVEGGVTTKSYMENWYTIEGGMVRVKNRFIDWNGFSDMQIVPQHTNELPATFIVHPLNHFTAYTGVLPWTNDTGAGLISVDNAGESDRNYRAYPTEDWFAWLNDEGFGVGVYVPNTTYCSSSRIRKTTSASENMNNCTYKPGPIQLGNLFNKPAPTSDYTSCYAFNVSYTAPVVTWTMRQYEAMEYEYMVAVDYLPVMREQFKYLHDNSVITNDSLSAWG